MTPLLMALLPACAHGGAPFFVVRGMRKFARRLARDEARSCSRSKSSLTPFLHGKRRIHFIQSAVRPSFVLR